MLKELGDFVVRLWLHNGASSTWERGPLGACPWPPNRRTLHTSQAYAGCCRPSRRCVGVWCGCVHSRSHSTLMSDALHGRFAAQGIATRPRCCHVSHLLGQGSCSFHFALRAVVLGNVSSAIYAFLHRGTASPGSRTSLLARRWRPPARHPSTLPAAPKSARAYKSHSLTEQAGRFHLTV